MKKIFALLIAIFCVSTQIFADTVQGSTTTPDKGRPEHVYTMTNGSNIVSNSLTAPTQSEANYGQFAFYQVSGVTDAYYIYSYKAKKWLSYTKASSYANCQDFVKMSSTKVEGAYFKVSKITGDTYEIRPYTNNGGNDKYLNWYKGIDFNPYDGSNTLGLWEDNGSKDNGSRWSFSEIQFVVRTYTINAPSGYKVTIDGKEYSNGEQCTYEGSLTRDKIMVSTASDEFAIVSINDVDNTVTVSFAKLPEQPSVGTYANAWVYPKQQENVGAANITEKDGAYTLYNKVLAASFVNINNAIYFAGSEAMNLVAGTEPFTVAFGNGDNVPASAMTLKNIKTESLKGDASAIGGVEHYDGKQLVANYEYTYKGTKIEIVWRAVLRDGSHYLRTEMELKGIDNVDMFNVIPMIYNVDTKAAGSTPKSVGNTRGAILISNKIFAGLETPTAYNTVGEATGEADPWELVNTISKSLTASSWVKVAQGGVPNRLTEATGVGYPNVYSYEVKNVTLKKNQKVEIEVKYTSGAHRLNFGGADILDQTGGTAASDYHRGHSGTEHSANVFTFNAPNDGTFTIRVFVEDETEEINASSTLTAKIYNAKEGVVVTKEIVGIQGRWSRNTTLAAGETWKVGAVVGLVAQDGKQGEADIHNTQKRRSFLAYSERERAVPWRAFPCYISWYEININHNNASPGYEAQNMTADMVLDVMREWDKQLYKKYNVAPAAFVIDDGWDNYGPWTFHTGFPNQMRDMATLAKTMDNAGVGAWLGPVGGYGKSGDYRRSYWSSIGESMQLSNAAYYKAFKDAAYNLVKEQGDNYVFFKFDGISNDFSATGPDRDLKEDVANEDAEGIIRLERYVREELRPDIFFNTTVGTWASPFWYQITDATWRQENDYGEAGNNSVDREKWITYRDRLVYQNYVQNSPICPINTLMTHGFILTGNLPGNNSSRGDWTASRNIDYKHVLNELRCAFICGSGMVELYNDYDLMNHIQDANGNAGALWKDLAECIEWQKNNADVLPDAHWVGGNPWTGSKHEVYGWASWNGDKATLALRNGANSAQTYTFTLRKALEIPANISASIILKKSFNVQDALNGLKEGEAINIDEEITVTLPANSVFAFDGVDSGFTPEPLPERFTIENVTPATGEVTEISQIRVNPNLGPCLAELPTKWTLTDSKGQEYVFTADWLYNWEEVILTVNPTITAPGKYTLNIPVGSLKTDDGKEVSSTSFTWVIKADLGDAYRIKATSQDKYLNIEEYNQTNSSGAKGSVGIAEYNDGEGAKNQIFYIVEEDGNTYLLSESGHYIVCRPWNIDACESEKSPLSFEDAGDGLYYIMNGSQYFKVGPVDGNDSSYYPYCDAPLGLAEKWELEKVGGDDEVTTAIDKVVSNQKVTIYDLTGRKIEKITSAGIYIINGNKVLVK